MMASANTSAGMAKKTSVTRMITGSDSSAAVSGKHSGRQPEAPIMPGKRAPAWVVTGEQSEGDPEGDRDGEDDDTEAERDLVGEDHPAEHVAPQSVGAEPMGRAGRLVLVGEVDRRAGMLGKRREHRCQQRQQQHRDDDHRTGNRQRIAPKPIPGARAMEGQNTHAASRMRGLR